MTISMEPGKYVVAVSGGVDSVVLLDLLSKQPDLELVVAHFDHGIRSDSPLDKELVATLSQKYGLKFVSKKGHLGKKASEDKARQARYKFLQQVRKKHQATAVVTAHHRDDALETMAFNVLRGTKRKGMSSLQSTDRIVRPLLDYDKRTILEYAKQHQLVWREDNTNSNEIYTRNWIRRKLLPRLSKSQRQQLNTEYTAAVSRNHELDNAVAKQLEEMLIEGGLNRKQFIMLPYAVACEVMVAWLRQQGQGDIDRKHIDVLVVSAKTLPPGKKVAAGRHQQLVIEADVLRIV